MKLFLSLSRVFIPTFTLEQRVEATVAERSKAGDSSSPDVNRVGSNPIGGNCYFLPVVQ